MTGMVETAIGLALGLLVGAAGAELVYRWHKRRDRSPTAARLTAEESYPIIHAWAQQETWFLENGYLNQVAQMEHMRLLCEEPGLTLEQNLARVAEAVREKYPSAFQTLH